MDRRRILVIWAVVVFLVVGAVMLYIGIVQGEDTDYGDRPGGSPELVARP
jgi:hypothetical protein